MRASEIRAAIKYGQSVYIYAACVDENVKITKDQARALFEGAKPSDNIEGVEAIVRGAHTYIDAEF